ncbi:MAG: VanZ family protein [Deltaproteobacteria bacterium]|nr:VanZ family protein [Deltaproteobacteria bacterium]
MVRFLILFFYYYVPVGLYLVLIYIISSLSFDVSGLPVLSSDKLMHILEYALLGFLFMRAYLNTAGKEFKVRGIFTTVFFTFLFGASDEYHQLYVPGRIVSLGDIAADVTGGFIGSVFYILVLYIILRKEKRNGETD